MPEAHIMLDHISAKCAILPGDPARLDRIKPFLENPQELAYNREFRSVEGMYHGIPVIALSTGVGSSSASIAVEELHHLGVEYMIRIGSCGALQKEIALGDLILVSGAIRDDGASRAYVDPMYPACPDADLLMECILVAREKGWRFQTGVVHSHESFYMDDNDEVEEGWSKKGVLGSDFETAALMTVGRLRGVKTMSILNNVVLYGEDSADSVSDYQSGASLTALGEQHEIELALEAMTRLISRS